MNSTDLTVSRRDKLNALSYRVLGLAVEVHRELGPGLLESVYEEAFAYELSQAGIPFSRQIEVPLLYKGIRLSCGYRIDLLIEETLIIELKSVNELLPLFHAQLLTYLRLARLPLGLLINFNVPKLKGGIQRVVQGDLFRNA